MKRLLEYRAQLVLVLLGFCFAAEAASPSGVGYRQIDIRDPVGDETFPVAIWYPTRAQPSAVELGPYAMRVARDAAPADGKFGLVVLSHGSGGGAFDQRGLAMALAAGGYVVAAPTHPRDNFRDMSGIGSVDVWAGRPRQASRVIDEMLRDPALASHIDSERVGVVGHSSGGYTALALAGARPSMNALLQHCSAIPDDRRFCSFGGSAAADAARKGGEIPDVHDRRIRAIVVMAPHAALFTDEALSKVSVPTRIYGAERDDLTPVQYHAARLARALGPNAEYSVIKGAAHFSFVTRLPDKLKNGAGEAARDPGGFDREAMQETLNPEIVAFFDRTLKTGDDRKN